MPRPIADPHFFPTPAAWRRWLEQHHATATEIQVGFHKKGTGTPSLTWPESVDEALCFGWIDGVRRSIDEARYMIRFTPRTARSTWSAVNIARVAALTAEGRMHAAGLAAFARRSEQRSGIYAYEQRQDAALAPADEARFRARASAWAYWEGRPPSYRRTATYWVTSARQEATRQRRMATLIECSAEGRTIPSLTPTPRARKRPAG